MAILAMITCRLGSTIPNEDSRYNENEKERRIEDDHAAVKVSKKCQGSHVFQFASVQFGASARAGEVNIWGRSPSLGNGACLHPQSRGQPVIVYESRVRHAVRCVKGLCLDKSSTEICQSSDTDDMNVDTYESPRSQDGAKPNIDIHKPFSSAERIHELTEIDRDITQILRHAGDAISTLASPALPADRGAEGTSQDSFAAHTSAFYEKIQAVSARLRRQIYALQEADIIVGDPQLLEAHNLVAPPMPASSARPGAPGQMQLKADPPMAITNGGLGNFDVAWLNSRRDMVGKTKEQELLAQARERLESLVRARAQEEAGDAMEIEAARDRSAQEG